MSGRFRSAGAFTSSSLQLRPVTELNLNLQGSPLAQDIDAEVGIPLNALLVDVLFDGCANSFIDLQRRSAATTEAANLLTVASWPKLWRPEGRLDWTPVWDVDGRVANMKATRGFYDATLGDQPTRPAVDGLTPCQTLGLEDLARGPWDHLDGELYVVGGLGELHAGIRKLPWNQRRVVNRALAWFAEAERSDNPSTAITSYVSCLESILPPAPDKLCPECGQRTYKLSARMKALLDHYAGRAMREDYRRTVYSLRSRLSHGEWHYLVDTPPWSITDVSHVDVFKVQLAARATLLNWITEVVRENAR